MAFLTSETEVVLRESLNDRFAMCFMLIQGITENKEVINIDQYISCMSLKSVSHQSLEMSWNDGETKRSTSELVTSSFPRECSDVAIFRSNWNLMERCNKIQCGTVYEPI